MIRPGPAVNVKTVLTMRSNAKGKSRPPEQWNLETMEMSSQAVCYLVIVLLKTLLARSKV